MVVHTSDPSIWKTEAGDCKFKLSLCYIVIFCLKQNKMNQPNKKPC